MPRTTKKNDSKVYQLKVTIEHSQPAIWRQIQVVDGTTLGELHAVLQYVMPWEEAHAHQFVIRKEYYGSPSIGFDEFEVHDEDNVALSELCLRANSKFVYEYDFGDSWMHVLVLEKTLPLEKGAFYPRCLGGARACPPEDCGGLWGFYDMLEAVKDQKHPEHDDCTEWLDSSYDPEVFNVDKINRSLAKAWKRPRTRAPG